MAYVYYSYLYNDEIRDKRHQVIENWFENFKRGQEAKIRAEPAWRVEYTCDRLSFN